jgi:hypothetical protein
MKKSEKILWVISILSFVGMLTLLCYVFILTNMVVSYRNNYYELLDIISQLNTKIHYPGG